MPLVFPKKSKCPHCSEEIYPGRCDIVSSRTFVPDPSGGPARPLVMRVGNRGLLGYFWVQALKGRKYVSELAVRQCPECKELLPRSFGHAESHTIAIIGDVGSGKTHYIASCIDQLKKGHAWQVIGCTRIVGQGNTDKKYWDEYYTPMYLQLEQLEATRALAAGKKVRVPLVYEMVFRKKSRLRPARMVNLLFYDSGGEDIRVLNRMVQASHYILNASAIIFLVDPLTVPGIVKNLPDYLKPKPGSEVLENTADVLNRIVQTFETAQGLNPGETLHTPIAVTISKSDLLKFTTKYGQTPLFLNDAAFGNRLDTRAFDTINAEVQDILQRSGGRELLTSVTSFANKNFFAVSATGWPPDDQYKFPNIEPLRCLDPLLWAFWKLGLIDEE